MAKDSITDATAKYQGYDSGKGKEALTDATDRYNKTTQTGKDGITDATKRYQQGVKDDDKGKRKVNE